MTIQMRMITQMMILAISNRTSKTDSQEDWVRNRNLLKNKIEEEQWEREKVIECHQWEVKKMLMRKHKKEEKVKLNLNSHHLEGIASKTTVEKDGTKKDHLSNLNFHKNKSIKCLLEVQMKMKKRYLWKIKTTVKEDYLLNKFKDFILKPKGREVLLIPLMTTNMDRIQQKHQLQSNREECLTLKKVRKVMTVMISWSLENHLYKIREKEIFLKVSQLNRELEAQDMGYPEEKLDSVEIQIGLLGIIRQTRGFKKDSERHWEMKVRWPVKVGSQAPEIASEIAFQMRLIWADVALDLWELLRRGDKRGENSDTNDNMKNFTP
jgi:hypothetical protein